MAVEPFLATTAELAAAPGRHSEREIRVKAKREVSDKRGPLALVLAALAALGPFCTDTYLPSMPDIGRTFGIPLVAVQQTLTAYMAPFAVMALWHGAISDAVGRRRTILVGLVLFVGASVGCALATSLGQLLLFRALQGATVGSGMVVGRAVVRDVREGPEAQRMMAAVSIVFAIAPAIAPVIGGWLQHFLGWRSVFAFMAAIGAAIALWCWRALPESLPVHLRRPFQPRFLARSYGNVMSNPRFLAPCLAITFAFSGFFIYVLSAPTFLMKHLHVGETGFLWLFGPTTAGMILGAWTSGRLAGVVTPTRTVLWGGATMATATLANVALHAWSPPGLPWSVAPVLVYAYGLALTMPSLTLMALDVFPSQRGLAASCQSFVQSLGNAANAALIAPFFWASALRLAVGQSILVGLTGVAVIACVGLPAPSSAPVRARHDVD